MKYVLTPAEMQRADRMASEDYGIPPLVLMENAALNAAQKIRGIVARSLPAGREYPGKITVNIFCGSGNNGGDGFAIARHLHEEFRVLIFRIGDETRMSAETGTNFLSTQKLAIPTRLIGSAEDLADLNLDADILVDALIGSGGSEDLRGPVVPLLEKLRECRGLRIAVDVPAGLNALSGRAHRFAFRADETITMFAVKQGMYCNEGPELCGNISCVPIGAPALILERSASLRMIEDADIRTILPRRKSNTSKFDYGRIAVIAGSKKYPGAACLCANAAIGSGAGLVELFTPSVHSALLPEIIIHELESTEEGTIAAAGFKRILGLIEKYDAIAIGPGLGDNEETLEACRSFLAILPEEMPVVIDADALRVFTDNFRPRRNFVLTPHSGEFARMTGLDRHKLEADRLHFARKFIEDNPCTLLLKGMPTIISHRSVSYLNITGNPGMATAGSGDVLTGIIAAFLGQKIPGPDAAALAAYLHGKAGDWYSQNFSGETLTAASILSSLKRIFPGS